MEPIILASASPRREEFFRLLGLPFTSMPSHVEEDFDEHCEPRTIAEELAERKVRKTVESLKDLASSWVFGVDTLIALDGKIYGKPSSREDAGNMLRAFSGRTHKVISGMALYKGLTNTLDCRSVASEVSFAPLSESEIDWYLDSGEWQGVAGAYRIQGLASCFITGISGSYSSIIGLPLREFYVMLRDNGYPYGSG